ncbi:restriction endonuclease subunit S [Shewanella xiamenensis]|uniref:restriction endonuclease subunit S n=1 Tax=Shewanella xiamenensis TaxID=332186 RepID=UPI0024471499|nr:restriction endonuclease subunit S [Shewanella xiamenensis]MDH1313579.1 restriction endonuclease subunit S [Shewanella xiamenensis]
MRVIVPSLRFNEFRDNWLEAKLSHFVIVNPKKPACPPDGLVSFIPMNAVTEDAKIISLETVHYDNVSSGFTAFQNQDVLFAKITPCFENGKGAFAENLHNQIGFGSTEFHVLRATDGICSQYVYHFVNTPKFRIVGEKNMQGSAGQKRVTTDYLKNCKAHFPKSITEQQKIADFLTAVDSKISQLTEKRRLLNEYKKGAMQQLFSQQLRFKDEKGNAFPEWAVKRLGDIASFLKGKGISKADIQVDGLTRCIRYGELYTTYGEVITSVVSAINMPVNELVLSKSNDVIVPSSGETQWDIATAACVLLNGIAYSGDLTIIRSQINGVFLSYYLNSAKKREIASLSQGGSVIHLYSTHLKHLEIDIPCADEQQRIAQFLQAIDNKIAAVAEQIEQTKQFKKGLLQQMFV